MNHRRRGCSRSAADDGLVSTMADSSTVSLSLLQMQLPCLHVFNVSTLHFQAHLEPAPHDEAAAAARRAPPLDQLQQMRRCCHSDAITAQLASG